MDFVCFQCQQFKPAHLHRDDVGPRSVGHCHPVRQVHAAVAVGPEKGMRVGYRQPLGALPPLGGVLWRLHKGNLNREEVSVISDVFVTALILHILVLMHV